MFTLFRSSHKRNYYVNIKLVHLKFTITMWTVVTNVTSAQKNYICKHLVLQAIRLNFVTVPLTAQTNQLEDMPKRGRKPTISKALQVGAPIKKSNKRTTTPASSNSKKTKI